MALKKEDKKLRRSEDQRFNKDTLKTLEISLMIIRNKTFRLCFLLNLALQ